VGGWRAEESSGEATKERNVAGVAALLAAAATELAASCSF
jgi:hypothetical protein